MIINCHNDGGSIFLFLRQAYKKYRKNGNESGYLTHSKLVDAMEIYCDVVLKFKPNEAIRHPISPIIKIKKVPHLKRQRSFSAAHRFTKSKQTEVNDNIPSSCAKECLYALIESEDSLEQQSENGEDEET